MEMMRRGIKEEWREHGRGRSVLVRKSETGSEKL